MFGSLSEKGLATVKQLNKLYPDVPIIVITNINQAEITQILSIGTQDYLIKSQTDAQLLIQTLQNAIKCKKLRSQLQQTKHNDLL